MASLNARGSNLASSAEQLKVINQVSSGGQKLPQCTEKLQAAAMWPLRPAEIEILQINMGKMCNQTCAHCHVDAGPDRKEIMSRETLEECLVAIREGGVKAVDLTGGAPEMNPHFRWFV